MFLKYFIPADEPSGYKNIGAHFLGISNPGQSSLSASLSGLFVHRTVRSAGDQMGKIAS